MLKVRYLYINIYTPRNVSKSLNFYSNYSLKAEQVIHVQENEFLQSVLFMSHFYLICSHVQYSQTGGH